MNRCGESFAASASAEGSVDSVVAWVSLVSEESSSSSPALAAGDHNSRQRPNAARTRFITARTLQRNRAYEPQENLRPSRRCVRSVATAAALTAFPLCRYRPARFDRSLLDALVGERRAARGAVWHHHRAAARALAPRADAGRGGSERERR